MSLNCVCVSMCTFECAHTWHHYLQSPTVSFQAETMVTVLYLHRYCLRIACPFLGKCVHIFKVASYLCTSLCSYNTAIVFQCPRLYMTPSARYM